MIARLEFCETYYHSENDSSLWSEANTLNSPNCSKFQKMSHRADDISWVSSLASIALVVFASALSLSLSLSDDKSDSSVNIQTIASRLFAESAGRDQQLDLSDGLVDNIRTFAMQTLPEAFPLIPENAKYRKATKWFDPTISKSQHRSKVFVRSVSLWEAKRKTSSQRPSEASETRQLWKSAQFRLRQNFKFIQNYA